MRNYGNEINLSGKWKFRTDPDNMGELYPDVAVASFKEDCKFFDVNYDDRDWEEIQVPANWQTEGYDYNGAAWYRYRFSYIPETINAVTRLFFLGADYFTDVWLNGFYLGSHEGFFNHFEFDCSRWISKGENLLVVKVVSPNDNNLKIRPIEKTVIKGALDDWDCNNLLVNPGGIYNGLKLLSSTEIYAKSLKVSSFVNVEEISARILCKFSVVNPSKSVKLAKVNLQLLPDNFTGKSSSTNQNLRLVPGLSEFDIWLDVDSPQFWWPWDIGKQHLYNAELKITNGTEILDSISDRIGLRDLQFQDNTSAIYINGKQIFCRGPNYLSDQFQSNMNFDKYLTDVRMMKEANMNMVRVYCVVEKEEFYEACDQEGILVYQDFPMQGRMSDSSDLVRRSVPQARDMVNQLFNHPSIVIWTFGAQPGLKNFEKICLALSTAARLEDPYRFIQQGASVWEWKLIKDKYDWPIDYHFFCGWFSPEFKQAPFHPREVLELPPEECASGASVEELKIKKSELLEFVSEYGTADSLPDLDSLKKFINEKDLWPVNWKRFTYRGLHADRLLKWAGKFNNIEEMIEASQNYQAFVLKYHTEFFRRHKFNPCNGALFFQFRDCWPALTASVVDYYGRRKKGYYTLQQSFNPIHVIMDWPDLEGQKSGSEFRKKIYIVNDYMHGYPTLKVRWAIKDCEHKIVKSEEIVHRVPENSIQEIGEVLWKCKGKGKEKFRISFELFEGMDKLSVNEYLIMVG